MTPTVIELAALVLVGPSARFIGAMSPDANNLKVIPPLWHTLTQRRAEIGRPADVYSYGACRMLPETVRSREDELEYLAGVNVAPGTRIPEGMAKWELKAGRYALFTHRGPITKLTDTIQHAHAVWLPSSGFKYRGNAAELERYDDRFGDGGEDSELDFLLPII